MADRESGKITYTNGDLEEREIHINNGKVHVHRGTDQVRSGNKSWEDTGHYPPDKTDKYVIDLVKERPSFTCLKYFNLLEKNKIKKPRVTVVFSCLISQLNIKNKKKQGNPCFFHAHGGNYGQ